MKILSVALIFILLNAFLFRYFSSRKLVNCLLFSSLGIYREKLQKFVADGELSEEDVKALERLQVMLCIPRETVEAIHTEICGSLFEKACTIFYSCRCCSCCMIFYKNTKVFSGGGAGRGNSQWLKPKPLLPSALNFELGP